MAIIRIALLLVVLGGLSLLVAQNWLPVLPLVFLGISTQALPLAVWILMSIAAGAFTSLFITGLFKLSNYFAQPKLNKSRNVTRGSSAQPDEAYHSAASRPASNTESTPSDAGDDWDSDSTSDDDWDFEEDADKTRNSSSQDDIRDSTNYEVKQEPKSGYRSGSVYSYNYREPKNSGVGKTESVYDADYRVLTPPYRETDTAKKDEDWGFEDDEEDENERDSPSKGR